MMPLPPGIGAESPSGRAAAVDKVIQYKRSQQEQEHRVLDEYTAQAFKYVTSHPHGLRFLWWLFEKTHMFQSTFTGNSMSYFFDGERNVGLKVLSECLKAKPGLLSDLVEEQIRREQIHAGTADDGTG